MADGAGDTPNYLAYRAGVTQLPEIPKNKVRVPRRGASALGKGTLAQ